MDKNNYWDKFAKENAQYYIDMRAIDIKDFWERGENNFKNHILPILKKYNIKNKSALDFGCGIGRHTIPLSNYFQNVYGVDISKKMLEIAQKFKKEKDINNIIYINNNEFYNLKNKFDFIYSINTFQHIEDFKEIKSIIKHMSSVLRGYAYLQFDTRPETIIYQLKNKLPDILLQKSQKHGIKRIRRNSANIKNIFQKAGLKIISEENKNSEYHFFLLNK